MTKEYVAKEGWHRVHQQPGRSASGVPPPASRLRRFLVFSLDLVLVLVLNYVKRQETGLSPRSARGTSLCND